MQIIYVFMITNYVCNHIYRFCFLTTCYYFLFISGVAGGLTNLSKMPACNLMLLGAQRRTLSGFSSTSLLPHTGYIYHCDVVQTLPPVSINLFDFTYSSSLTISSTWHCMVEQNKTRLHLHDNNAAFHFEVLCICGKNSWWLEIKIYSFWLKDA